MHSPFHLETLKKIPSKQHQHQQQHFKCENIGYHQENQKNLQVASVENRGLTKLKSQEVIHLIENTIQPLNVSEKRCSWQ